MFLRDIKRSESVSLQTVWEERILNPAHQVSTEHEEADEVDVGQVAAAAELFAGLGVGFRVAASTGQSCQHNLLPLLSGGTPSGTQGRRSVISIWPLLIHTRIFSGNAVMFRLWS